MPSPPRRLLGARTGSRAVFLWLAALSSVAARAQAQLQVAAPPAATTTAAETGGTLTLAAEAGSTITVAFRLTNSDSKPRQIEERLTLPAGWRAVLPPQVVHLAPGGAETRLVLVAVPARTPAGRYLIVYCAADSAEVVVQPRRALSLAVESAPQFVAAGDTYQSTFQLQNRGNAPATVQLGVSSSEGLVARTDSTRFELAPEESRRVSVRVTTTSGFRRTTPHRLEVRAVAGSAPGDSATSVTVVSIVPQTLAEPDRRERFPMEMRVRLSSPVGAEPLVQFSGYGPVSSDLRSQLSFLARGPQKGPSLFGEREEYHFSLRTPQFTLRGGDRIYAFSPLSEVGRYARGVEAWAARDSVTIGAAISRSRYSVVRDEQRAAYVNVAGPRGTRFSVHGLQRIAADTGALVTARSVLPLRVGTLDLEYGRGVGRRSAADASSLQLSGFEPWGWYSLRRMRVDADYPGSYRGTGTDYAGFGVRPVRDVQVGASIGHEVHAPAAATGTGTATARQHVRSTWAYLAYRETVTLEFRRHHSDTSSGGSPPAGRLEETLRLRLERRAGSLLLMPSVEVGTARSPGSPVSTPFQRFELQASLQTRAAFFYGFVQYDTHDPYDVSADPALAGSVLATARLGRASEVRLSVAGRERLGPRPGPVVGTIDGTLEHRLPFRHRVAIRGRYNTAGDAAYARRALVALDYTIPLGVPLPREGGENRIAGVVIDGESGKGIPGVLLRLEGQMVITDKAGRWAFGGLAPGAHAVSVDPSSLVGDRVVPGGTSRTVELRAGGTGRIEFRVVRAARVFGTLLLLEPDVRDSSGAPTTRPLANAEVSLRGAGPTLYRRTDQQGRLLISGLTPGRWTLQVEAAELPPQWAFPQDVVLNLAPGESAHVTLRAEPRARPLRILPGGDVGAPRAAPAGERPGGAASPSGTLRPAGRRP